MIHVIATIELRPGTRALFLGEFGRLVPTVRAEHGCIYYAGAIDLDLGIAAQDPVRPDVFTVVERWESAEALGLHAVAPHMLAFRELAKPYMMRTTLRVLEPAGEPG